MSDVGHREIKLLIEQVQNGTDDQKAVAAGVLGRLASIHELPVLIASAGGIESLVVTWFSERHAMKGLWSQKAADFFRHVWTIISEGQKDLGPFLSVSSPSG